MSLESTMGGVSPAKWDTARWGHSRWGVTIPIFFKAVEILEHAKHHSENREGYEREGVDIYLFDQNVKVLEKK